MPCITRKKAEERLKWLHESGTITRVLLQPKITAAKELISEALSQCDNPTIAFSGGKDSLVVLDLVRQIVPGITAVFENTGNEYPETVTFVRTIDNVIELHPDISFWECAKKYGLPQIKSQGKSHGNQCCIKLKEQPFRKFAKSNNIDAVFTGLTAAESRNRMMMLSRMGPLYWNKREKIWKCHPIANWTDKDVWQYIKLKQLKYNPIYDIGIPRCGCRFCTAYLSWKEVTALYNIKDTKTLLKFKGYKTLLDTWTTITKDKKL